MRKFIFPAVLVSCFIFLGVITSCEKCDDSETDKTMTYAIVKGYVRANLDMRNDTNEFGGFEIQYEKVPAGTRIIARINSADLANDFNPLLNYEDITFEATVDNNGDYTLNVYAGVKDVNVLIMGEDFEYEQWIKDSTREWKKFTTPDLQTTVVKNLTKIEDMTYLAN